MIERRSKKTDDRLDAKETRDAIMIVGGRGGEEGEDCKITHEERNRDT